MTTVKTRAIIFDMDGTMIDNMMVHHRAWQLKLASLGLELTIDEVIAEVHGINEEIMQRLFGDRFTKEEADRIAWEKEKQYRDIIADRIRLLDGLQHFLDACKKAGVPMGIGTAAPPENVEFGIERLNLQPYITTTVHSKMVSKGKPDPEVFKKVADGLNVPLHECLVFEDSPTGARTAHNGNCPVIVLTTTHKPAEFSTIPAVRGFIQDYSTCTIKKGEDNWFIIGF
ncbi:MAG: beta-phosphoglucomutase [Cytophagaceae bacterium]|nr:beta-phosphoglucomutase [Cytophagaceae bacterium]|tara:strand:- start:3415 stop:4098 length:684 start_codon:yes stop_codon:yes gene_type:complete